MTSTEIRDELSWSAGNRRLQWMFAAFLAVFGTGALALAILAPDNVSESPWMRVGVGAAGLLAFAGVVNFAQEARRAARRLVVGAKGIEVLQGSFATARFAWQDVGQLKTKFASGDTIRFTFLARDRKHKLLTFSTEGAEQPAHDILRMIWGHLRDLVTQQCETELADPARMKFAGISKVVDVHANLLTIEFPKGKKTPLHLDDIVDVGVTSAINSTLRIHHRRGALELPMAMPCSGVLLQWLWSRVELAGRVLPPPREDGKAEHARLTRRLGRKSAAKLIGTAVLAVGAFQISRGLRDIHPPSEIRSSGIAVQASYLEQAGTDRIKLAYVAEGGEQVNLTQRVEPQFFDVHEPGATLELFYLPADTGVVWFEDCWYPGEKVRLGLVALLAVLVLAGLSAIGWGSAGTDKINQRLSELVAIPSATSERVSARMPPGTPPLLPPSGRPAIAPYGAYRDGDQGGGHAAAPATGGKLCRVSGSLSDRDSPCVRHGSDGHP